MSWPTADRSPIAKLKATSFSRVDGHWCHAAALAKCEVGTVNLSADNLIGGTVAIAGAVAAPAVLGIGIGLGAYHLAKGNKSDEDNSDKVCEESLREIEIDWWVIPYSGW